MKPCGEFIHDALARMIRRHTRREERLRILVGRIAAGRTVSKEVARIALKKRHDDDRLVERLGE